MKQIIITFDENEILPENAFNCIKEFDFYWFKKVEMKDEPKRL